MHNRHNRHRRTGGFRLVAIRKADSNLGIDIQRPARGDVDYNECSHASVSLAGKSVVKDRANEDGR